MAIGQEYKNIDEYRSKTGNDTLTEGVWLEKDRKRNTDVWQKANAFNLQLPEGNLRYKTIAQIRDFYEWFDSERIKKGHQIEWIGIAANVASQLSILDNQVVCKFIVRDRNVLKFAHDASKKVFAYAFVQMREVFSMNESLTGLAAKNWDADYGRVEQCEILEPIYESLPAESIQKLEKMAKGKGIYRFGVPKGMEFEGNIKSCQDRIFHAVNKVLPNRKKKN